MRAILSVCVTAAFCWLAAAPPALAVWTSMDIGTPSAPGSMFGTLPGPITILGDGDDIWGNSDNFHFAYDTTMVSGDFTAIARLDSQQNTNAWAKAGIMARADLTAGSVHNHVSGTISNAISHQWRNSTGGGSGHFTPLAGSPNSSGQPYWLMLDRVGNDFYARWAPDDNGSPGLWQGEHVQTTSMPTDVYLGLSVTSHSDGTLSEAVFTGVDFNYTYVPPPPPPAPDEAVVRQSAQPLGDLGFNYLYVEAEDWYQPGGSFERSTNPVALATAINDPEELDPVTGASRGQAITNTYENSTVTNTSGGGHDATWLVEFDQAGDYWMFVRHHSPLGSADDRNQNDSVYLPVEFGIDPTQQKANGDDFEILQAGGNGDRNARGPWLWFAARDGVYTEAWDQTQDSGTFQVFTVAPGEVGEVLRFQIDHREDGTMIDSIVFVPVGGPVTPENADTYFGPLPLKRTPQSQSFGDDVSELGYSMVHGGTAGNGHWARNSTSADPGENYGFTGFDGDYFFGRKVNEGALGASDTDPAKLLFDPLGFPGESDIILSFLLAANNDEHGFDVDQDYLNVGFDTDGDGQIDIPVDSFVTIVPPGGQNELRSVMDPDRPITDAAELWTYDVTIPDGVGAAALVFDYFSTGASEALAFDSVQITGAGAAIPEPSTFALAALGLLGLGIVARRRRK